MRILQVNQADIEGGAERVARDLAVGLAAAGHQAWMAVDVKKGEDAFVLPIPRKPAGGSFGARCRSLEHWASTHRFPGSWQLARLFQRLDPARVSIRQEQGYEPFDFPGSACVEQLPPERPELVHLHNLHGYWYDLHDLARLSCDVPTVLTLHDEWMLTGHCAYTLGCERWREGCGACPHLDTFPAVAADVTDENWRIKQGIYANSCLHVATPSQWLHDRVAASMMNPERLRVIHNGIDLSVFHARDRAEARSGLGIGAEEKVLLYVANPRNPFKDFACVEAAVDRLAGPVTLVSLGGEARSDETVAGTRRLQVPYEKDPAAIAELYRAADLFLYATRADNFPLVILEAMACGAAVVATAVGGIDEQVTADTGVLVGQGDADGLAEAAQTLLDEPARCRALGEAGAQRALAHYGRERMVQAYADWYAEILEGSAKGDEASR